MPTIDLSTPPPPSTGLLADLPRRAALTLPELRLVAEQAGGAPLPFDAVAPGEVTTLEDRLGRSRTSVEDQVHLDVVASLRDPADTLSRRGLMAGGRVDAGLVGAVGMLAAPQVALDLDVTAGGVQARAWHRQAGEAVATLSTCDGIVFELAWFPTSAWPAELARVAVVPEEVSWSVSSVPETADIPYELADAAVEAMRNSRSDLVPVLAARHRGRVVDADGAAYTDDQVAAMLTALTSETQGRLRGLVADVSHDALRVVGVVSWVLLADGWRALRPHEAEDEPRVELRRVEPSDLAPELAPVLAAVTP